MAWLKSIVALIVSLAAIPEVQTWWSKVLSSWLS